MTGFNTDMRALALSALLAAAPLGFAHAQSVEEGAVERFGALVKEMGIEIEWSSVDYSGDDATLVDVSVGVGEDRVAIGDVTLSDISQAANGYRVETIEFEDYELDDGSNSSFSVSGVMLGGVLLPREGEEDAYGGFMFYETGSIDSITVTLEGTEVLTLSDMTYSATNPENGGAMEFSGAVDSFTVDLSVVEDPSQAAIIQALGYEQFEGYVEVEGSWNPADGRLTMSHYGLTVIDAGSLGFSFDLGGYTPAFIASLRQLQQQMAANPDADNSAQGLAMLGLMQQLTFHSAEIGFEDDSLTNKVLELVAQMQGMSASDIRNQAKAVLPFALAQLNSPELTASATQAVSAFLDDPQSLYITAEPASPVPFALIMAEAMSAPQGLIRTLAVGVTANE